MIEPVAISGTTPREQDGGHSMTRTGATSPTFIVERYERMTTWIRWLLSAALLATLALGLWMRASLAGVWSMGFDFAHLRHAHSHLGAYGVLFPLAFLAWRSRGAPVPGRRTLVAYGVATALAVVGFLRAGYGPEAIVGSTVVGAIWLSSAFQLRGLMRRLDEPLALVPPGIVAAMACVPFIALTLRKDPVFAQHLVATFLGTLLLVVVTPSALSAIGARAFASPVATLAGLSGALALGVWPNVVTRVGLAGYGLWLASVALQRSVAWPLRAAWGLVGAGLMAMAAGLLPNVRPSVVGALHFLVLGPVLLSLLPMLWPSPPRALEVLLLAAAGLVSAPLVAQAVGLFEWTMQASAVGGALVFLGWLGVLFRRARVDPRPPA